MWGVTAQPSALALEVPEHQVTAHLEKYDSVATLCCCEAFTFGHGHRQRAGLSGSLLWSGTRIGPVLIRADTSCKKVGFPGTEEDKQQRVQIQVKKHNWKIFSSLPLCCWVF